MRAATFMGPGKVGLAEYAAEEPRPGWVRIAVSAVGICGSDLHLMAAHVFPNEGMRPGHELSGFIDALGDGVTGFETGQLVTAEPLMGCESCYHCRHGYRNRCPDFNIFGLHSPGAIAEYFNVPADLVFPLDRSLDVSVAALVEPMAVSYRGVRLGKVQIGDRVAVIGSGTIGLMAILAAKEAGAAEIHATARYPKQAELARLLGADHVHANGQDLLAAVGNQHIDVAVETVGGTGDTIAESVRLARPGGMVVMLGIFEGNAGVPGFEFAVRELTLVGSSCYGRERPEADFGSAIRIVQQNRTPLAELVTHRFGLDQVPAAFATAADKTSGSVKVQIMPRA